MCKKFMKKNKFLYNLAKNALKCNEMTTDELYEVYKTQS